MQRGGHSGGRPFLGLFCFLRYAGLERDPFLLPAQRRARKRPFFASCTTQGPKKTPFLLPAQRRARKRPPFCFLHNAGPKKDPLFASCATQGPKKTPFLLPAQRRAPKDALFCSLRCAGSKKGLISRGGKAFHETGDWLCGFRRRFRATPYPRDSAPSVHSHFHAYFCRSFG